MLLLTLLSVLIPTFDRAAATRVPDPGVWEVVLDVTAHYPDHIFPVKLNAELLYPSPDVATLSISRGEPGEYVCTVRPRDSRASHPSHVIVRVWALGLKPETLNSGVVRYRSDQEDSVEKANVSREVEFKKQDAPEVEQVIRLKSTSDPAKPVYEVTLLNASDSQVNVTAVALSATLRNSSQSCAAPVNVPLYAITLRTTGSTIVGAVKDQSSSEPFSYDLTGSVNRVCGGHRATATAEFNFPVPPKQRAYLRFEIQEPDNPAWRALARTSVPWQFSFLINKELLILGEDPEESLNGIVPPGFLNDKR